MTRYLCDTDALIASICVWHAHHQRTSAEVRRRADAGEEVVLAAHSVAEVYSVLTRMPGRDRLRSEDAIALMGANWSDTPTVHLTARETWDAVRQAQRLGVTGGQTYDALIAHAASKAGASTILTWNVRHFAPFAGEIAVESPP